MVKKTSPHELILLYAIGFKPKQIISLGYPKVTVYKYNQYFKTAQINLMRRLVK